MKAKEIFAVVMRLSKDIEEYERKTCSILKSTASIAFNGTLRAFLKKEGYYQKWSQPGYEPDEIEQKMIDYSLEQGW